MNAKVEWPDSLWFHQNPQARKWDKSYTREVVIGLTLLMDYRHWLRSTKQHQQIKAAKELLEQYWHDLHLPYEQRDEARELLKREQHHGKQLQNRVKELESANRALRSQLAGWMKPRFTEVDEPPLADAVDVFATNYGTRSPRTKAAESKPVEFFACQHYPCATTNYFQHIAVCEHGCESVPLKWCDNGHHRKPQ